MHPPGATDTVEPGRTFERYSVLFRLGRGGMAEVWAARHTVLGTLHAVKILRRGSRDQLVQEGRLQARLDPDHVVQVTDVLEVDGAPALVMPMVHGCSLRDALDDGAPPVDEALAVFRDIAEALAHAHEQGIVHRDLKPGNVLLSHQRGRLRARIADFGIAQADEAVPTHGAGTPAYAAPEQLTGDGPIDHRADLWSLGMVLWELLTGRRPFVADSVPGLLRAAHAGPLSLDEVPAPWDEVLASLLAVHPDDRPAAVDALPLALLPPPLTADSVLGQRVLDHRRSLDASLAEHGTTPSTLRTSAPPHALPREVGTLFGRDALLEALDHAKGDHRLVSLVGLGGTGKTRLAIHHARRVLSRWSGGAWFCDLAQAVGTSDVLRAIAAPLDIVLSGEPRRTLREALAARGSAVLLLDNAEHVLDIVRDLVAELLDAAPHLGVLVTTRRRLDLPDEHVVSVPALDAPAAVALFLHRAAAARPGYDPTPDERTVIGELVERLDRLPLALELAAARVRTLSPERILERIDRRFRLLSSRSAGRHASLRATLDTSWQLLEEDARQALAQLTVFEGVFDLDAAEGVLELDDGWAVDALEELADHSLLVVQGSDRFALLETVGEYAAEKLESDARIDVQGRHARYFAELGAIPEPELEPRHFSPALLSDLLVACGRAITDGDAELAVPLCTAAARILAGVGPYEEAARLLERVLGLEGATPTQRAWLMTQAVHIAHLRGRMDEALSLADGAVQQWRQLGDPRGLARSLRSRADVYRFLGTDRDQEDADLDEALALARECGDGWLLAGALQSWESRPHILLDQARAALEEARAVVPRCANRTVAARLEHRLGTLQLRSGRPGEASHHFRQALDELRAMHNRRSEATLQVQLARCAAATGDADAARAHLEASLELARLQGNRLLPAASIHNLAEVELCAGRARVALEHATEGVSRFEELQSRAVPIARATQALALLALDDPEQACPLAEQAVADSPSPPDAAFVVSWYALARAYLRLDRLADAEATLQEALDQLPRLEGDERLLLCDLHTEVLLAVGRIEEAAQSVERARGHLDGVNIPSRRAIHFASVARVEAALGRIGPAREALAQAEALAPDGPSPATAPLARAREAVARL